MRDSETCAAHRGDERYLERLRAELHDDHAARAVLCASLESVADGLPVLPPAAKVRRLCAQIELVTSLHFRRAEALLTKLEAQAGGAASDELLRNLADMHVMDAVHAEDLIAEFWACTAIGGVARPGEFGYMLRCFFDGCRRAIALETALAMIFLGAAGRSSQPGSASA